MLIRIYICFVILMSVFAATSNAQDKQIKPGQPLTIWLEGDDLVEFIRDIKNRDLNTNSKVEAVKSFIDNNIKNITSETGEITGFASAISRSITSAGFQDFIERIMNDTFTYKDFDDFRIKNGSTPQCVEAFKERTDWYTKNRGYIPASFGKILNYHLHRVDETGNDEDGVHDSIWDGYFDVCTWVGPDEYYWVIEFRIQEELGTNRLTAKKRCDMYDEDSSNFCDDYSENTPDPFPGTMLFAEKVRKRIFTKGFKWKLNAANSAIDIVVAKKNGANLDPADPILQNPASRCIDMFTVGVPISNVLPPQGSFCLGRCDGRIMNSE